MSEIKVLMHKNSGGVWVPVTDIDFSKSFNDLTDLPTTLSGYGIVDAVNYSDLTSDAHNGPTQPLKSDEFGGITLSGIRLGAKSSEPSPYSGILYLHNENDVVHGTVLTSQANMQPGGGALPYVISTPSNSGTLALTSQANGQIITADVLGINDYAKHSGEVTFTGTGSDAFSVSYQHTITLAAGGNLSLSTSGSGKVLISSSNTGNLDNVVIGATTPKDVYGTNLVYKGGQNDGEALYIGTQDDQNIVFITEDSEWLTITPDGKITTVGTVGIGTNNPPHKLTIKGGGTGTEVLFSTQDSGGNSKFEISDNGLIIARNAGGTAKFIADPTLNGGAGGVFCSYLYGNTFSTIAGAMTFGTGGSNTSNITFRSNAIDVITIQGTDQKVGIGTSTPAEKLEVDGNVRFSTDCTIGKVSGYGGLWFSKPSINLNNYTFLSDGGHAFFNAVTGYNVYLRINNTTHAMLHNSGRFGIGTETPSAKLHTISTTEQLRIGYDASNYFNATVGNTGAVTFSGAGSATDKWTFGGNIVGNGTANRLPNQTATTDDSVITKQLALRSQINNAFNILPISFVGESRATGDMTQLNGTVYGGLIFTANALAGDSQWLGFFELFANNYYGSGSAARWEQKFTLFFEFDTNYDSPSSNLNDYSLEFLYGKGNTALPTASDKCLAVRMRFNPDAVGNNTGARTLEAAIYTGTEIISSSIPLSIGSLANKQKLCIVWDGSTLFVYMAEWNGSTSNLSNVYTLVTSVTMTPVVGFMSHNMVYLVSRVYQNFVAGAPAIYVSAPQMIRQAIHPL